MSRSLPQHGGLPVPLLFLSALAVSLVPALALWMRGSANQLLFLLLLFALIGTVWRGHLAPQDRFIPVVRRYWPIWAALAAQFLAACLSTVVVGLRDARVLDQLSVESVWAAAEELLDGTGRDNAKKIAIRTV
jgi:hypothetical protein